MRSLSRSRWLLGLALLVTLVSFRPASGQGKDKDKEKGEDVHFDTADGVKIEGSFWPGKDGKKSPVAILLHDFHAKNGGDCHSDGWDNLAAALNKQGFAVLQFDFRGFGKSKTLSTPMTFWNRANQSGVRVPVNPLKLPETIDFSHFTPAYYGALANDVGAAKAFLDRKNDGGELNSSNTVLIGAGQGASVGALWLATEFHKKRGVAPPAAVGVVTDSRLIKWDPNAEGKDIRAAVWLGISPTVGSLNLPVRQWVIEGSSAKANKVPTVFIFGKEDTDADARALSYMQAILPEYKRKGVIKDNPIPLSGDKAIEKSGLKGSKLLLKSLETENWIVNDYLGNDEMKKTLKEEWRDRDSAKAKQYWLFQGLLQAVPAKSELEFYVLPLGKFGVPN